MSPEEADNAVATSAIVVARTARGHVYGEGRAISYSLVPTVTIERADGSRFSWRHDMTEVKPTIGDWSREYLEGLVERNKADNARSQEVPADVVERPVCNCGEAWKGHRLGPHTFACPLGRG